MPYYSRCHATPVCNQTKTFFCLQRPMRIMTFSEITIEYRKHHFSSTYSNAATIATSQWMYHASPISQYVIWFLLLCCVQFWFAVCAIATWEELLGSSPYSFFESVHLRVSAIAPFGYFMAKLLSSPFRNLFYWRKWMLLSMKAEERDWRKMTAMRSDSFQRRLMVPQMAPCFH